MHLATLVATARNEGPFFWEWAAHHFSVGFDRIIIFQNDSNDLTHAVLKALEKTGRVQYIYNAAPPNKHQRQAYQRATRQPFYKNAEWIMALDLDEFLQIKTQEGTVESLVDAMPSDSQAMLINWRLFGNGGFEQLNDQLITERFTRCSASKAGLHPFKALFRRDSFRRPGVHRPVPIPKSDPSLFVNGSAQPSSRFILNDWRCNDRKGRTLAQINHYILRDAQSFVLKVDRGRAHQIERPINKAYWTRFNKNEGTELELANRTDELREWMARLDHETGGELSALTARARQRHHVAFNKLIRKESYKELYDFCTNASDTIP